MDKGMPILAVHDGNLNCLLEELGLLHDLESKGIPCGICNCNVTRKNLGYIYFIDRIPKVCCDKITCLYEIMKQQE